MDKNKSLIIKAMVLCFSIITFFVFILPGVAAEKKTVVSENTDSGENIIKLNLITQIKEKISTDAGSTFVDLTPKATQIGLPNSQLYGSVRQEALADETTRMYISWHSIGISTSNGDPLIGNLDSPLKSQIRTEEEKIEPGEIIMAQGDLDSLIEKFLELKEQLNKKDPTTVIEEEEEDDDEHSSSSLASDPSGTRAGGDNDDNDLDSASDFSTNLITSSWEDCSPRIDEASGYVYAQNREVETDEEGETVSIGTCQDTGDKVAIIKEYGDPCDIIFDYTNGLAYEQYQKYAVIDGETIQVTTCSNDFSKSYEIYGKTGECGYRHDFDAGVSILQELLYYTNNEGEEIQITESCVDSDSAYKHYLTESTCTPYHDEANGIIQIYKRTAFKLSDGTIEYASECRAVDGDEREVFEKYCEEKYEHDFTNGISYYRTQDYYLDTNNNPVYLTDCTRSTTTSFSHVYNSSGCNIVNNDEELYSIQYSSICIDPPEGTIVLKECADNGTVIPYTYVGYENRTKEFTSSGKWTVPTGVTNITVFVVAGGNSGGDGLKWKGWCRYDGYDDNSGGGVNGGSGGGSYRCSNCKYRSRELDCGWLGDGGGGGAGEQVTKTINVTPGNKISFTIGASDQDSKFGNFITARHDYGSLYNGGRGEDATLFNPGNGGNGYGSVKLAKDGGLITKDTSWAPDDDQVGYGGIGYGAGGGGGFGGDPQYYGRTAGGAGAPGYIKITYTVNKYKRGDRTYYIQE